MSDVYRAPGTSQSGPMAASVSLQLLVAFGVWSRNQLARWLGVLVASVNAITLLLFLPAYPFAALAVFAVDCLVIYGLIAHGSREPRI